MTRLLAALLLLTLACSPTHAAFHVLRDSIGSDSSLTDGLPGGSTLHGATDWATPGFTIDTLETGVLIEAMIIIFARDLDGNPEFDLADIYDFSMDFHLWSDGIQGGTDSFFDNAVGNPLTGHIAVSVNSTTSSVIMVEEFGETGPPIDPTMFKTYRVTIDLSSFGIALQGGEQYVAAVIDPALGPNDRGILFRVIGSLATGFEDLYQQNDTLPADRPGKLNSQLNFGFEQYAAKLTLGNGDFDGDDDVDGRDFLVWQRSFGTTVLPTDPLPAADANGDRTVDGKDLAIWQATYGKSWAGSLSANVTVPEPGGAMHLLLAALGLFSHRGHRGCMIYH